MQLRCKICDAPANLLANERVVRTCGCPQDTGVVVSLTAVLTGDAVVASDPPPPPATE